MSLTVQFMQEIRTVADSDKPAIVRKYGLTCEEIEKAGKILREEKEGRKSWGAWKK
jgi:hypothetical protein